MIFTTCYTDHELNLVNKTGFQVDSQSRLRSRLPLEPFIPLAQLGSAQNGTEPSRKSRLESLHFELSPSLNSCNAKRFQENFKNWTSGNDDIDKFIQHTQLSAEFSFHVVEWIPYDRFYDIKYIAKGGFGKVYRAKWIDGYIKSWDNKNKNWKRENSNKFVALKSLNNSENITLEFINEV